MTMSPAGSATATAFTRQARATRVLFGPGRIRSLAAEADRLGAQRVMLVASGSAQQAADSAARMLGARIAGRWNEVSSHVSTDLAKRASGACARSAADAIVAIGGGASTGVAKAVALETGLPIIAVPTTYAGSEVTATWGLTEGSHKTTGTSERVVPRTVIYDPLLTLSLPPQVSATSGMNAMAHCVEALYGPGANPATSLLALDGIRKLAASLPRIVAQPADLDARSEALYAAYLAGLAMAEAGTGLHHKICHVLGGMYDLPHAELHAVLLPHTVAFMEPRKPDAISRVAAALNGSPASGAIYGLNARVGAPTSLRQLGVSADQIEAALPQLAAHPAAQAIPALTASLRRLLGRALNGQRPAA